METNAQLFKDNKAKFKVGDKVKFEGKVHKKIITIVGIIIKKNPKKVRVKDDVNGVTWDIPYHALFEFVDKVYADKVDADDADKVDADKVDADKVDEPEPETNSNSNSTISISTNSTNSTDTDDGENIDELHRGDDVMWTEKGKDTYGQVDSYINDKKYVKILVDGKYIKKLTGVITKV